MVKDAPRQVPTQVVSVDKARVQDDSEVMPTGTIAVVKVLGSGRFQARIDVGRDSKVQPEMRFLVHRGDLYLGHLVIGAVENTVSTGILTPRSSLVKIVPGDKVKRALPPGPPRTSCLIGGFVASYELIKRDIQVMENRRTELESQLRTGKQLTPQRKNDLKYQIKLLTEELEGLSELAEKIETRLKLETLEGAANR